MILFEDIRSWWRRTKTIRAEEALLSHLPRAEIDASKLGKIDKGEIERILTEPKLHEEWLVLAKEIDQLILIEDMKTGGVNPGDRRALYYWCARLVSSVSWKSAQTSAHLRSISLRR